MNELELCLELSQILSVSGKYVEDDTCLDRVLSSIKQHLTRGDLKLGADDCTHAVGTLTQLPAMCDAKSSELSSSSVGFILQLTSIILPYADLQHSDSARALKSISLFPATDDAEYSIANAWLAAIKNLVSSMRELFGVSYTNLTERVLCLTSSPSVFVCRQAMECLAEIGIHLNKVESQKSGTSFDGQKNFCQVFMDKERLTNVKCMVLATKMLLTSYDVAVHVLSSIPLTTSLEPTQSLMDLCESGDAVLCHFFETLYSEQLKCFPCEIIANLMPDNLAFSYAAVSVIHNPTKALGWKMLSAFIAHNHSSPEVDRSVSIIVSSLGNLDICTNNIENGSLCVIEEWTVKLQSMFCNSLVLAKMLSHVFTSISPCIKFTKSARLIDSLHSFVKALKVHICSGAECSSTNPAVLVVSENHNTMMSLLKCLIHNCNQFMKDHVDDLKTLVSGVMSKPSLHHGVIKLCHELALSILTTKNCTSFATTCVESQLNHFIDRRWEVRDTSLEFLASLLSLNEKFSSSQGTSLHMTYSRCKIHQECLRLCGDDSPFVRASAVSLIGFLVENDIFKNIEEPLELTVDILSNDIEASPRRAAALALLKCIENSDYLAGLCNVITAEAVPDSVATSENLCHKMYQSVHNALFEDFDWEVKYNAIDILSSLIEYEQKIVRSEIVRECLKSMLEKMRNDYDDAVRDKAHKVYVPIFGGTSNKNSNCNFGGMPELHDLLVETLASLQQENQGFSCHSLSSTDEAQDSVILDCY